MIQQILHPAKPISIEQIAARLGALEKNDQRFAQRGGDAVTYASNGRIASLNADYILAGTIDAGVINVTNINADNIDAGTLSANRIGAASITASKISVSQLSAIAADLGTITAGTVTGATIRTSSSGQRVELTSDDYISFYNSSGNINGKIYGSGSDLVIEAENAVGVGQIYLLSYDGVYLEGGLFADAVVATDIVIGSGTLDMNGKIISAIDMALFSENTSAPSSSDGIWYYKSGGSYGFRSRMEGGNWGFDQSSI